MTVKSNSICVNKSEIEWNLSTLECKLVKREGVSQFAAGDRNKRSTWPASSFRDVT